MLITIIVYTLSPRNIITHISEELGSSGVIDARGDKIFLFIYPVILIICSEIIINISMFKRRKDNLLNVNIILVREWNWITGLLLIALCLLLTMLSETGIIR